MNKISVNMTPNPSDIQTLHCSQGDTEERKFQFVLHNQGEVFDSENISDPVFTSFSVEVGGTEEILPTNGTSPSTSPIIADITYPDGLREGEEFTYRESPTTIDGNAKVNRIKGNTLVWNQLVQNGNFADGTNNWTGASATISASNGELTVTIGGTWNNEARQNLSSVAGHKYLGCLKVKSDTLTSGVIFGQIGTQANATFASTTTLSPTYQTIVGIATVNESGSLIRCTLNGSGSSYIGQSYTIKDVMLFDLTQMFGAGNEPTTVDEFTSLFPLPYYSYDSGSLLSFNGSGIKTVGKNMFNYDAWKSQLTITRGTAVFENNGITLTATGDNCYTDFSTHFSNEARVRVKEGQTIILSWEEDENLSGVQYIFPNGSTTGLVTADNSRVKSLSYTPTAGVEYITFRFGVTLTGQTIHYKNIMIRFADADSTFEPYTENTTNLPTLTYFPTGMKSAGSVYDELTPTKAVTRIGAVDLGTLTWERITTLGNDYRFYSSGIASLVKKPSSLNEVANIICSKYEAEIGNAPNQQRVGIAIHTNGNILVYDTAYASSTAVQFKSAMSGVYLFYELATPNEQSILSASFVTENGEAPLYHNGECLECECNENISSEPGFFYGKIAFTDSDGTNYSNKIQLHVERSPQ